MSDYERLRDEWHAVMAHPTHKPSKQLTRHYIAALEEEVSRLRAQGQVIDVRPAGRYLENVYPVTLNVVEDGQVEYLTLALGEFTITNTEAHNGPGDSEPDR